MINDNDGLKRNIKADENANIGSKNIDFEMKFRSSFPYMICRYLKLLRKLELVCYQRDNTKNSIKAIALAQKVKLLDRKKNRLGLKLGIEIPVNHVKSGIKIAHPNVILNGYVGENCIFHGNNVLGNKKTGVADEVPHLGNNVDVGVGAIIIGNVEIADNCMIGAGSVVTNSFTTPGTIIAGVPAKEIKK